jgi:O-antigen ligase
MPARSDGLGRMPKSAPLAMALTEELGRSYPLSITELPVVKRVGLEARSPPVPHDAPSWTRVGVVVGMLAGTVLPATASGTYFPTSWGWAALAFGWAAAITLVLRRSLLLSRLDWAMLAGLLALTSWMALSSVWSENPTQTVLELERAVVYLTAALAVLLIVNQARVPQLVGGVLTGIALVAAYALATRLFPDQFGGVDNLALNRLARPLGYWNALGIFTAMGCLLALDVAARARSIGGRALAGAALPILVPTLYFTFGRGPWIALALGAVVMFALAPRRLQLVTTLIVAAPAPAVAVWLASHSEALTSNAPSLASASHEGHRLAVAVLGLSAVGGLCVLSLAFLERRLPALPRAQLAYRTALCLAAVTSASVIFAVYGSPWAMSRRGYDAFKAPPVRVQPGQSLNKRLLSFSGNWRFDMWHIAWRETRRHPWVGSGPGTYEQYWLRYRPIPQKVRDAHGLYIETLAELGPLGLGLLLVVAALPLVAAVRARNRPFVAGVSGAYVAYLAHAGVDWDWEMGAVTLVWLFCGAALLISARDEQKLKPLSRGRRAGALALTLAAIGFAFVGLISNSALSASARAADAENWRRAESQARKAIDWAPWSLAGWQLLGEAQLQQAKLSAARASFRRAIAKDHRDWSLWLDLALASEGASRRHAAATAARLNPLSPEIARLRTGLGLGAVKSAQ